MAADLRDRVSTERRFAFGRNWKRFARTVGEEQVREAVRSLQGMLEAETLAGRTFLDMGSGSGLFSLAAARLGADRIHSIDYDPESVECTEALKRRFLPVCARWTIERGSVLNRAYLDGLGEWDVVYSWGVLHHTGAMWEALGNVGGRVAPAGLLFVSIYNDQGWQSKFWTAIKRFYNRGRMSRSVVLSSFLPAFAAGAFLRDVLRGKNPLARYGGAERGMAAVPDWIDWLGGYPFEVATPGEIVEFFRCRGFELRRLKTVGGRMGCNEFVLGRTSSRSSS